MSLMFVSSRCLFPMLPQQCAYCHYCKLDLQIRTQELRCPLRDRVVTCTSTIYQHYSVQKNFMENRLIPFKQHKQNFTIPLLFPAVQVTSMVTLYDNIRQNQCRLKSPQHSWYSKNEDSQKKNGICITVLMHMDKVILPAQVLYMWNS